MSMKKSWVIPFEESTFNLRQTRVSCWALYYPRLSLVMAFSAFQNSIEKLSDKSNSCCHYDNCDHNPVKYSGRINFSFIQNTIIFYLTEYIPHDASPLYCPSDTIEFQ